MSIRNKLVLSFSSLVIILLISGGVGWKYISGLNDNINEITDWKIPAGFMAVDVHAGAYEATIEQLRYLLHGKEETHQKAKVILAKMDKDLAAIDKLARTFDDQALLSDSAAVKSNVSEFRMLYEQGVKAIKSNKKSVATMVSSGNSVIKEADDFAAKQEYEYKKLMSTGAPSSTLDVKVKKYIIVNNIKSLAYKIIQHEKQERLYQDRQYFKLMKVELPKLMRLYKKLEKQSSNKLELQQIKTARLATKKYQQAADSWIENDNALKGIIKKMDQISSDARSSASNAENMAWQQITSNAEIMVSDVKQANFIILINLIIGLVLGVWLAIFIPHSITKSINELSRFAASFGRGNLQDRAKLAADDEIGVMAKEFNRAVGNIQNIISSVSEHARDLANHADGLSATVASNVDSAHQQKESTEQVASAISQMSSSVVEVAQNASQAASSAAAADTQANEGNRVVTGAVNSIHSLAGEIDQATTVIQQLETNVGDIGGILEVIRNVSEQTNLLALNAAIEAARAGEHGRGFAVVADEVRTLASRTQSSTNEIQAMIEKLQKGAKSAVVAMSSSQEIASQSVEQASNSGLALTSITDAISTINDMNTQIALSASQQSVVTGEIKQSLMTISGIADASVNAADSTLASSRDLARLSSELEAIVGQFKV
ncbi:MAG: methyl-accepting chemotaxis protein [Methyloprofundus sp.]|nr:methyl-accepting chemotaxis protein [Methyloprofundus sp.]